MNTSNILKYAPKARRAFIAAITKQAAKYGIAEKSIAPVKVNYGKFGDLLAEVKAITGKNPT